MKGVVVSGEFGDLCVREKSGERLELGELLVAESGGQRFLLQVCHLLYGSQLDQQHLELVSGLKLEEDADIGIQDASLRLYVLGRVVSLLEIEGGLARAPKCLPPFFSLVRSVGRGDFDFLHAPQDGLSLGFMRSGSKTLDVPVVIDGRRMLSHHVLVAGTTGRGKSVLMKHVLWNLVDLPYAGVLVLDPHDEYFGRSGEGLSAHPSARSRVVYYTSHDPPPGAVSLRVNVSLLHPSHFQGIVDWSDAQREALHAYYGECGSGWVEAVVRERQLQHQKFGEGTLAVIKRRLLQVLSLEVSGEEVRCAGAFCFAGGESTVQDVLRHLHEGRIVIVDTKHVSGHQELLMGSMIATEVLNARKRLPAHELEQLPLACIVLEEAPRVIGRDVLERGANIFGTIAREGRKFHVGMIAITQLPSLIPREILANMNTKIILGTELKQERQALMESAAQDLSRYDHLIAALDKGEALVSSTFTKFPTPIMVPLLDLKRHVVAKRLFEGVKV
ncbi:ATP-binding protein [Candidatus Woesearchaeota archaeon]|nr:ATP-binding protein [Candidatus Woesearchaeota archaeon]